MKHATIPVFVPHYACKHRCVFCDQKKISGTVAPLEDPTAFLTDAVRNLPEPFDEADIAFFGGSFTGLSKPDMARFLAPAYHLLQTEPRVKGIRLSTRPDYIDADVLSFLHEYGVTTVELGAQSMDDNVLLLSGRGHTAEDTRRAAKAVRDAGFSLVLQFMPGLPGDTDETVRRTVEEIIALCPDAVRIYPCVVIKDTVLEKMYREGSFMPLSVGHAVELVAEAAERFNEAKIRMIRVGLHASDLVRSQSVVAGPFHPAFGELVTQRRFYTRAQALLASETLTEETKLKVPRHALSQMVGQKRDNLLRLETEFHTRITVVEDDALPPLTVKVVSK